MKTKLLALALVVSSLSSCANMDALLVKNTGLTSTDALLLGIKTKERIDLTLKEYNVMKSRNLPSGKSVVEVVVAPAAPTSPVTKPSMIDNALAIFGF